MEEAKTILSLIRPMFEQCAPLGLAYDLVPLYSEDVRDELVSFCKKQELDLLVLGSSSYDTWSLGSVAVHCLHHCPCPIAIYKKPK